MSFILDKWFYSTLEKKIHTEEGYTCILLLLSENRGLNSLFMEIASSGPFY